MPGERWWDVDFRRSGQKFSGVKVLDFIYTDYIHPTLLIPTCRYLNDSWGLNHDHDRQNKKINVENNNNHQASDFVAFLFVSAVSTSTIFLGLNSVSFSSILFIVSSVALCLLKQNQNATPAITVAPARQE